MTTNIPDPETQRAEVVQALIADGWHGHPDQLTMYNLEQIADVALAALRTAHDTVLAQLAEAEVEWAVQHPHPDHVDRDRVEGESWIERESEDQAKDYGRSGYVVLTRSVTEWRPTDA